MMQLLFSPDYTALWTAIGAVGQVSAAIIAVTAILYSIITFNNTMKTSNYGENDRAYHDLLKIALEKPYLRNMGKSNTDGQLQEYDIYAFMIWNFLEAIYDRCEKDHNLKKTWYPVIQAESLLHGEWFSRAENRHKFKESFHEFISKNDYKKYC